MTLADKTWISTTVHDMVVAFLQAERYRFTVERYRQCGNEILHDRDLALIDQPNLENPNDNHRRWRLLNVIRAPLLGEIPPDTQWYKVLNLQYEDLNDVHAIARCGWDDDQQRDNNELLLFAKRRPREELQKPPAQWPAPIFWGHRKEGPFTIIEGNHRLTNYVATPDLPSLDIPVIIGLSLTPCCFHIFDPAYVIANDLWHGLPSTPNERPAPRSLGEPTVP